MNKRKSIFINLDGTVIDIAKNIPTQSTYLLKGIYNQIESKQNSETLFANAQPIPKAINAIEQLNKHYNLVFYCTYPWNNIMPIHKSNYGFKNIYHLRNNDLW